MVKIMENPIKMDDLGVPLFLETPISRLESTCLHNSSFSEMKIRYLAALGGYPK